MLGGSAPAGLSFLSKAARHSSGFTKSSEDETNPVASLCESCRQTTPTPTPPSILILPLVLLSLHTDGGGQAGSQVAVWALKLLGIGFNLMRQCKKESI